MREAFRKWLNCAQIRVVGSKLLTTQNISVGRSAIPKQATSYAYESIYINRTIVELQFSSHSTSASSGELSVLLSVSNCQFNFNNFAQSSTLKMFRGIESSSNIYLRLLIAVNCDVLIRSKSYKPKLSEKRHFQDGKLQHDKNAGGRSISKLISVTRWSLYHLRECRQPSRKFIARWTGDMDVIDHWF